MGGVLFCGFCFIFGGVVEGVCECCICVYVERRACIYKYEESGSVSLFVYLCVCWLVSKSIGGGICVRGGL